MNFIEIDENTNWIVRTSNQKYITEKIINFLL